MKADSRFTNLPLEFWANIKLIGQNGKYTDKETGGIKVHTLEEIKSLYEKIGFDTSKIINDSNGFTDLGTQIHSYLEHRAAIINNHVRTNLMSLEEARVLFFELKDRYNPQCPLPENKQKEEKKSYAFLTGIVNMLIEANAKGYTCNYDPRSLTIITKDNFPLRIFSRRVDGAFPQTHNPIAVWEIKEYYYTTTFGSRVADGVYETLLDGFELAEAKNTLGVDIEHYLFIDDYRTWWTDGRSYLCRIVDMIHMGTLTEVVFGREVVERLPPIVAGWIVKQEQMK